MCDKLGTGSEEEIQRIIRCCWQTIHIIWALHV